MYDDSVGVVVEVVWIGSFFFRVLKLDGFVRMGHRVESFPRGV